MTSAVYECIDLTVRRAFAALLVLVAACDSVTPTCTLRGDMTGLTINLSAVPAGAYSVEVVVPSPSRVSYLYQCDGGVSCRGSKSVFFPGLVAQSAIIRVTTTAGTRTTEQSRITYTDTYPNGRSCEPRSTTATATAALPE